MNEPKGNKNKIFIYFLYFLMRFFSKEKKINLIDLKRKTRFIANDLCQFLLLFKFLK